MKIREASRKYGVLRIIQDRIRERVKEGTRRMEPNTILSKEDDLEEWLIELVKCGFPKKKSGLLDTVKKIMKEQKKKHSFQ